MTGPSLPRVLADLDAKAAEHDSLRAAIAQAAGIYDCPCGSAFVFIEGRTLEDYAALNRWLGEHSAADHGPNVDAADVASLASSASFAAVMGMPAIVGADELAGLLAELAAMAKREYRLVNDAAVQRRFVEQLRIRLDAHESELDALTGKLEQARHERDRALARLDELGEK